MVAVTANGWVSDDAFITLRLVANLLDGDGATWNVGDRVQVFTHPLWAALLVPTLAALGSGWWAALSLGIVTTAGSAALLARHGTGGAVVALALLVGSRSFVDYSTAGLENPLLHLILLALLLWRRADAPVVAGLLGGLALLTRLDSAPLVLPLVLARWSGGTRRGLGRGVVALVGPQAGWMLVSLVWFGALLPNPALAKLGAGVPRADLVAQGVDYLVSSGRADPAGVALLAVGLGIALVRRDSWWAASGLVLHLGWLLWAGGDFMAGRFLTPGLAVAAGVLARAEAPWDAVGASRVSAAALGAALLAGAAPWPTWAPPLRGTDGPPERLIDAHGVADERRYYAPGSALAGWRPGVDMPQHPFRDRADDASRERTTKVVGVGMTGFFGRDLRIVDVTGVTDPFLARLPARAGSRRPGHFYRDIPFGYRQWFEEPRCGLRSWEDTGLCDDVRLVVRGPLLAADRWRAIGRLLVGDVRQVLGLPRAR
jgi:arabinofuranosyltransferase